MGPALPRRHQKGAQAQGQQPNQGQLSPLVQCSTIRKAHGRITNRFGENVRGYGDYPPLPSSHGQQDGMGFGGGTLTRTGTRFGMSILDSINPSLTRYRRDEPAPVLPLRDEPDLLTLLEANGRLVADEETASTDVSTVEEEELSALMGEKEDYTQAEEPAEEDWED